MAEPQGQRLTGAEQEQKDKNALRSIMGMKSIPEEETKLFGIIPSGGYQTSMTPEQTKMVDQIGQKLYGKDFDIEQTTPSQWKDITKAAGTDYTSMGGQPPGGPKSTTTTPTPESAYQKLADEQANQYLGMIQAAEPLTSGANLPAIESTASQQASQMLGASATSPVSQWLNAQTQAAQGQNAPVAAAMAETGTAETSAANMEAAGLKNMGTAENQMMQAAPYQQLLNTLAADVPYKLLGGTPFSSLQPEVSQAVSSIPGLSTTAVPQSAAATPQLSTNSGIIPPTPTPTTYPGVTG